MAFVYTRGQLKSRINAGIQNKIGMLVSANDMADQTVREVMNMVRIRSSRRKASLVPNLYSQEFEYACPTDLHGPNIIDIPQQASRADGEFNLVPSAQFLRYRRAGDISINDFNGTRVLLINSRVQDYTIVLDPLSQVASQSGASWATLGDATNLQSNADDYVQGSASLQFDIGAGGATTAGIVLNGGAQADMSSYIAHSAAVFVNARITSTTGLTNFKLRLGSDSSNYYEFTVTVRNDGTAFATGWNLLRFDMLSGVKVGTPVTTAIDYKSIFMTKLSSKVNEFGYEFNYMQAKRGKYADVLYYSKFGWIDGVTGAYKEFSTLDSDLLVCESDEFTLFTKKGIALAARETDMLDGAIARADKDFTDEMHNYQMLNPSEDKAFISTYYDYGTRQGSGDDDGLSSRSYDSRNF